MPQAAIAAYSIYQGVKAGKQADKAQASRDAATRAATEMSLEDRNYYRQKFGPMNQMLIDYAMGNKPSPYLAAAKGQVEKGYQSGMTQLNEIQANQNLGQSGIGVGQKLGLGMERAKTLAGLDLQDQAQRYGVAQSLSSMENQSLVGSTNAMRGYGMQGEYANQDMGTYLNYQNQAFAGGANALGSYVENAAGIYGMNKGNMTGPAGNAWLGIQAQQNKVESGGNKSSGTVQ